MPVWCTDGSLLVFGLQCLPVRFYVFLPDTEGLVRLVALPDTVAGATIAAELPL